MKLNIQQKWGLLYISAYLFLFVFFIAIFCKFAYSAPLCRDLFSWLFVVGYALLNAIMYCIISHIAIQRIVGLKTVLIFEILLFVSLMTFLYCRLVIYNL